MENKNTEIICWMGGSRPAKPSYVSSAFARIQKQLFREQVATFSNYWKDRPDFDTMRIFFNRARYDAHATLRNS